MALLKHIPTGDLYVAQGPLMKRLGDDMVLVNDDGSDIVEASPVPEDLKAAPAPAPKKGKGKAIQIEGEE